jgi:hypothetical protein
MLKSYSAFSNSFHAFNVGPDGFSLLLSELEKSAQMK